MNFDVEKLKEFRFETGHFQYFLLGSWIAELVVLIMLVLSAVMWDYRMDAPTIALWVLAVLLPLPEFYITYRSDDDFKKWQLHTVFSFVIMAMLCVAMVTWIDTGHGTSDSDMFFGIIRTAKYTAAVWGVYTLINLAAFLFCAVPLVKASRPEPAAEPVPVCAASDVPAEAPAGYRQNMDLVLRDIERFSAPSGQIYGLAERDDKGGN